MVVILRRPISFNLYQRLHQPMQQKTAEWPTMFQNFMIQTQDHHILLVILHGLRISWTSSEHISQDAADQIQRGFADLELDREALNYCLVTLSLLMKPLCMYEKTDLKLHGQEGVRLDTRAHALLESLQSHPVHITTKRKKWKNFSEDNLYEKMLLKLHGREDVRLESSGRTFSLPSRHTLS